MPVAQAAPGTRVCVTGAGGYVASHLVKQLLEKGYIVHGTVRDPSDEKKNGHLKSLPGASERLSLLPLDLEGPVSAFESAIAGCECIFHTATPVSVPGDADARDRFEAGMAGVRSLLKAVDGQRKLSEQSGQGEVLKCLVHTSSVCAMALPESWGGPAPPRVFSEDTWQDEAEQKDRAFWYGACKTQQEKEILSFRTQTSAAWRYVVVNPAFVIGEMLQPAPIVNLSMAIFASYLKGREAAQNDSMFFVEVGDCARVHIAGFENEQASGRYMACHGEAVEVVVEGSDQARFESDGDGASDGRTTKVQAWAAPHFNEIYRTLAKLCPNFKPPVDYVPGARGDGEDGVVEAKHELLYDLRRMNTLVPVDTMRGMEEMFKASIDSLRERNALPDGV